MRSQEFKSVYYTKPRDHARLIFQRCFVFICLTLMFLFVLPFVSNVTSAAIAEQDDQSLPQIIQTNPNASHKLDLLMSEITMPKIRKDQESKNKLKRLIEQVRSVQFKSVPDDIRIPDVNDEIQVPEPNETIPDVLPPKTEEVKEVKVKQPYDNDLISDRTLKVLKNLLLQPDKLNDPLEMGEILFNSGKTQDAVFFYEEALKRTDPNEVSLSQDRAWILFQLGNCLRKHELPAAAEIYRKILIEYPNSPWANLAKAQRELIEWRLQEKPHELLAEPENRGRQRN